MGQVGSSLPSHRVIREHPNVSLEVPSQVGSSVCSHRVIREHSKVSLEVHLPPTLIEFDTKESYMVSYGIDRQTNPKFQHKPLPYIVGNDAETLVSNFHTTSELHLITQQSSILATSYIHSNNKRLHLIQYIYIYIFLIQYVYIYSFVIERIG